MGISKDYVLEAFQKDDELLDSYFDSLDQIKNRSREDIVEILESFLTNSITDEEGRIRPDALTDEELERFERELLSMFSPEEMDDLYNATLDVVNSRLNTVDQLMRDLRLEEGILGEVVKDLPTVLDETDRIANSIVKGRNGDDDHKGAVERIRDAFNKYRTDRSKSRAVLRDELFEELRVSSNIMPNYVHSIATTSLAGIDRRIRRVQSGEAGIDLAIYVGPFDDLTRDFCLLYVDKAGKWELWDSMQNEFPEGLFNEPVSKYCGGINCRHRLRPYMPEWGDEDVEIIEEPLLPTHWREGFNKSLDE